MLCNTRLLQITPPGAHTAQVGPGHLFMPSAMQILQRDNLSVMKFAVSDVKAAKNNNKII